MEDVQPDTVLTFGPDGMTGHVAHMSVSDWATEALADVGKPGAKVHYATNTQEWADEFVSIYNRVRRLPPGDAPGHAARRALASISTCPPICSS